MTSSGRPRGTTTIPHSEVPQAGARAVPALAILYEDPWVLAVNKPAGIIVHGDGTGALTLLDLTRAALSARDGRDPAMLGHLQPLQRLDRDTTGIVLISKRKDAQAAFDRLIAERKISKRYLAIVVGAFPTGEVVYRGPIGRDRHDSHRMRISRTGKDALTVARCLARVKADRNGPARSLLAVDLHTGRKHQIRVHLSHAGYPIVGDALYGRPSAGGLMLHAAAETFTHPITGNPIAIHAPYPARFRALVPEPPAA